MAQEQLNVGVMNKDIHRLRLTISEKRLSKLIDDVQKQIDSSPAVDSLLVDELDNYRKQAEYMRMYAFTEIKDPYRQQVFDDMVNGLQRLSRDVVKCTRVELSSELRLMKKNAPECNFELASIRRNLEDFVSSLAMASITGENEDDIIDRHFKYMKSLFDFILTGRLWNETKKQFFSEMLSSPVVDSNDAQVLVSAIMMSTLLVSDEYKIETLLEIYTNSNNEDVRLRAFVGWVLGLHAVGGMCDSINERVQSLVKDQNVMEELLDLQMQIFYCSEAEAITDKINKDIIPGIVNNGNFKLNRFGVIDVDDDEMKNIIKGNGDSDKAFEEIEKTIEKMKDMEKKGSDIYFGGFGKMKTYGFFYSMVNWFYPYINKHPELRSVSEKMKGTNMMGLVDKCPFCNSDKYSFALAMSSVYQSLPEEVKKMLAMDGVAGMAVDNIEKTPSYKRRIYMQDVYRFYKLNASSKCMDDPFKEQNGLMRGFFFDDYFLLCDEMVQAKQALARFLVKKRPRSEELNLLFDSYESSDINDKLLRAGHLLQSGEKTDLKNALDIYHYIYKVEPDNECVLQGLIRCLSQLELYDEASIYSQELIEKDPTSKSHMLNHSILLIKCNRSCDANNILFKLHYDYPNDRNVMRVLAWCLLMEDKKDKSIEMFDKLMSSGKVTSVDNLNAGFARWVSRKEQEASEFFAKYVESESLHELAHEFDEEREFLGKYEILEVDMCMMLDLVEERTKQS